MFDESYLPASMRTELVEQAANDLRISLVDRFKPGYQQVLLFESYARQLEVVAHSPEAATSLCLSGAADLRNELDGSGLEILCTRSHATTWAYSLLTLGMAT